MKKIKQIFVFLILLPLFCAAQQNNTSSAHVWKQYSQANDFMSNGNYKECIMCCEDIVESPLLDDASLYKVLDNLGISYINTGHPDKALPYMERACAMTKYTNPYDSYFLSHCYSVVGRQAEAISSRKTFLDYIQRDTVKKSQLLYAQALGLTAADYIKLEDYNNAIEQQKKAYELHSMLKETSSAINDLYYLALYYEMSGNYSQSIELREQYNSYFKDSKIPEMQIAYARSLSHMASSYGDLNEFDKALDCGIKSYNIYKEYGAIESNYYYLLHNLAGIYIHKGQETKSLNYYIESEAVSGKMFGKESKEHIKDILILARQYSDNRIFYKTDSLVSEALNIINQIEKPDSAFLIEFFDDLASIFGNEQRYDKAVDYLKHALSIIDGANGNNSFDYGNYLCKISYQLWQNQQYQEAIKYSIDGIDIIRRNREEDSLRSADSMLAKLYDESYIHHKSMLAKMYDELGFYNESLSLLQECLDLSKTLLGENSTSYGFSLGELSSHYRVVGDFPKALDLGEQTLAFFKELEGEDGHTYANMLGNVAIIYGDLGNYKKATELEEKGIAIIKKISGEQSKDYAIALGNLSLFYMNFGDYEYALRTSVEASELKRIIFGENNINYALALNNLGLCYERLSDYDNALINYEKSYAIREQILGSDHPDVAASMNNIAGIYVLYKHDSAKAEDLYKKSLLICKNFYGESHHLYTTPLQNLAILYFVNKDYHKAIEIMEYCLNLRASNEDVNSEDDGWTHRVLASCYLNNDDEDKSVKHIIKSVTIFKKYILDHLNVVASSSRESFWRRFSNVFDNHLPAIVYLTGRTDISSVIYNESALFSKGLLLNTERSIQDLLFESKDEEVIGKFKDLQLNKNLFVIFSNLEQEKRSINIDSLELAIRNQERELINISETYGDYKRYLNVTWNDVQQKLNDNDLAIEFLSFETRNDSVMYIALTLDKNDSIPKIFTLFEKKQIDSISVKDYYTTDSLYNLIWKPLEKELEGKENIYFSPAGALYNIGIEYLPIDNNENIADRYNLIRLSSTRELVMNKGTSKPTKAALYGGLLYNIDPEVIQEDNLTNNYKPRYAMMMRGLEDSLNVRGDFSQLGYTLREVENIDDLLTRDNLNTKLFTKYNGTEESFKSLDGQRVNILHLATHGSYIPEEKAAKQRDENNHRFIRLGEENKNTVIEDQSLTRSFLVMSGGNMLIHGDSIPDGLDDGILTAQEISKIDLRGLDLVVLSACQTGLGYSHSSEGVYGLQRAFKLAGAKKILMSMWSVSDYHTALLMDRLYSYILSGDNVEIALSKSKDDLRKQFHAPVYWGGFVLLN